MSKQTIDQLKDEVHEQLERLRRERDDLKVRIHLAKAEARDEWEKIEERWHEFQHKAHAVRESAGEASKDVGAAARLLGEELAEAYRRIRKATSE